MAHRIILGRIQNIVNQNNKTTQLELMANFKDRFIQLFTMRGKNS